MSVALTLAVCCAMGASGEARVSDCALCHTPADWRAVTFNHDATRLPLRDRHAQIPCNGCHVDVHNLRLDPACGSCHPDPHAGRLGRDCGACHESSSFRNGAFADAHRSTRFPLYGRHAAIPCEQCHRGRNDATFGGVPSRCEACHMDAYRRTAGTPLDHVVAGFGTECQRCHTSVAWERGVLAEHDRCFPLTRGNHRGIQCFDCHTSLGGLGVQQCLSMTAACSRCHRCSETDREHREVGGYQCVDRKCYECHPSGSEDG